VDVRRLRWLAEALDVPLRALLAPALAALAATNGTTPAGHLDDDDQTRDGTR
jgi:hypothetical protein